ncbi:MAG TPA: WXG100 family type VII secretion target [Nakamurella sp.]
MAVIIGMDPAEVRALAQQLLQASTDIAGMVTGLSQRVQDAPWAGQDRENFVNAWQQHHVAALNGVAQALGEAGNIANQNAQQQEDASNA